MTNLEKLTSGDIAARHNGTLEQLREVINHSFPKDKIRINGTSKYYYLASWDFFAWYCSSEEPNMPTIDITQLWEELKALKKPETWWIRVTGTNILKLRCWAPQLCFNVGNICGITRNPKGELYQSFTTGEPKGVSWDFGNEIDFTTFLKYTGVEVENPEKVEKSLDEKISEVKKLIDHRGCLLIQFDVLKDEINGIETKLSALLK